MTELHLDFETRSKANLKKTGAVKYARHPSTRVLMLGFAVDDHDVHIWLPHLGPMPEKLRQMLLDPKVKIIAHNAAFERAILLHVLGIDVALERFICTQAMALSLALPADLDTLTGPALRLPADMQKDREGKRLIKLFCKPNEPTKKNPQAWNDWNTHPEDWEKFCAYNRQDVISERKVHSILSRYVTDIDEMVRLWALAQRINERGVHIDTEIVRGAQIVAAEAKAHYQKVMIELSGLANPNSPTQALAWLQRHGYPYNNMRKERLKMALDYHRDELSEAGAEFIKLRLDAAKTSVTKFAAMEEAEIGSRLYGMFQFRGAGRTGRFGGRIVQLQNLARPDKQIEPHIAAAREMLREADYESCAAFFDNPLDVVKTCIRPTICAPDGKRLVVADYSAIELVVLAWLTGCEFWLDVLRKGLDPYKSFGVHFLSKPYDEINKKERNECKPGALGAGYRLGGGFLSTDKNGDITKTGLWGYAESLGVELTQAQAARAVEVYRELSPEIVNFWYELEYAVLDVIRDQKPRKVRGLVIDVRAPFLRIRLPSGRHLHYCRPKIERRKVRAGNDENGNPKFFDATNMTYEGMNQTTKKWEREATHGGKLTENIVQAIALDLLNNGLTEAEDDGFNVILHVHDEIGTEEFSDDIQHDVKRLIEVISRRPEWAPDLPLAAAGYESPWYKKD